MLYIQQSLAPDEKLIYVAKFHWFYDVQAITKIIWGLFLSVSLLLSVEALVHYLPRGVVEHILTSPLSLSDGTFSVIRKMHPAIKLGALMIVVLGLMKFAQLMVIRASTEVAVTTSRLVYKRGLVARSVGEMNIDRIESISVQQSFWGRIFDFGRLVIHGMGVGEIIMPNLAEPIRFRQAIEKARTISS